MRNFGLAFVLIVTFIKSSSAQVWGIDNSRTDTRPDAGLSGASGAMSGFYETEFPVNFPVGATSWWHLLDVRHNNPQNNYAMQLAGSFFDQDLYFRKTSNNAGQAWSKFLYIDGNGNTNAKINIPTTAGQIFFTGHQLGGTYAFPDGIFRAVTDNPNGVQNFYFDGVTGNTRNFYVRADGQGYLSNGLAIGTTDSHGYKLAVGGGIIGESVTVKLQSQWPDYVFKPTYKLPSLNIVKAYIDKNQHLPDMPSEADVAKVGINLGEIVKLQTKKIEELTLYLIEQNRQLAQQKKQLSLQAHQLKKLQHKTK